MLNSKYDCFLTCLPLFQIVFQIPPKPSKWTVQRVLRGLGMENKYLKFKPLLTKGQRNRRRQFALKFKHYRLDQWKKVIFSDEKLFRVKLMKRIKAWVPTNRNVFAARYLIPSVARSAGVMVWGAINGSGALILRRCPPKMDSTGYQSVLQSAKAFINPRCDILSQDNWLLSSFVPQV